MQVKVKSTRASSDPISSPKAKEEKINPDHVSDGYRIPECIFIGVVHVLGLAGLVSMFFQEKEVLLRSIGLIVFLHYLSCLGIGSGVHRLWAHRSYSASTPIRVLLMFCQSLAFQGSIFHWARDHRLHHKFSDTMLDPHSMERGFFFSHVGWLLLKKTKGLVEEGKKLDVKDLLEDPVVVFQKNNYFKMSALICFVIPTMISYYLVGGSLIYGLLTAGYLRYIIMLHATWCVNSVCHMFGTRPYNSDILPTENWMVSLIVGGEGWHNWHHEYPRDWRTSENKWWKWNPNGYFIQFWELFGLTDTQNLDKFK